MKCGRVGRWSLGLVVMALLVTGGTLQDASGQPANNLLAVQPEANKEAATQVAADQETALGEQTEDADLAEAATKPISTEKPLPPSIKPVGPLAEVIKLAGSGVEESVIMAFVTNSPSPFNLGVEEIIYLNDIGVSGSVVTAMMQRDQALKGLSANAAPVYAPEPATAPTPPEMAPEAPPPADYAAESYPPPPADDTGYSTFYDSLAPYGTWVDVAGYGRCWQPTVVVENAEINLVPQPRFGGRGYVPFLVNTYPVLEKRLVGDSLGLSHLDRKS